MGVRFRISLYCDQAATAERAFAAAFQEIGRLEKIFSDYDPTSETRLIDAQPNHVPIEVSPDMRRLLQRSLDLHRQTDGYFDVSLGALTKLWRASRRSGLLPEPSEVADAAQRIGSERIHWLPDGKLHKQADGFELDFGGIAKGDAADQVLALLAKEFGITRALVDASGDVVAADPPPGQPGWVVGLSRPADQPGLLQRVYLSRRALASSGDANQFVEIERTRWSHLLDPHAKQPIVGQNLTWVFADDGATADAWASALAVCPPEVFRELMAREDRIIAKRYRRAAEGAETETLQSKRWDQALETLRVP
jgi:thiamine biosynthesis lipoprotein